MTGATVVLFDIDGTLLTAKGAGRRAMEEGFAAVIGSSHGLASIRFAGGTDPAIVREGLEAMGQAVDDRRIDAVIEAYLERLPPQLEAAPPVVLPGVLAMLDRLEPMTDVAIGIGTGNVEAGARAKLRAAGLDERFGFGGFGSDHHLRAELLRAGARRGAAALQRSESECAVLVIGDTPKDVAAAHAIGARCMAVATSYYDADALRATGADLVVEDLEQPEAMAWLHDQIRAA
ncbi:MAG: HAD family hydrolase [Myxococcota bacterium]